MKKTFKELLAEAIENFDYSKVKDSEHEPSFYSGDTTDEELDEELKDLLLEKEIGYGKNKHI